MPNDSTQHCIIKDGIIQPDHWHLVTIPETGNYDIPPGDIIVPLKLWQEQADTLSQHPGKVGIWINSHEEPEWIADKLRQLPLIAINFPIFTDGRGYSYARLLRERYHFQGEIRAIGDVTQDQLFYMRRCGFDSFALKEGKDMETALNGLATISQSYQAAVDQPQPLFRRR
ncbi:MAG: DUF934 domain-containing protein [Pseudomonadales bacterium]|nr:DUF934 domain-containing protein [Pseudomonadales bacterium]